MMGGKKEIGDDRHTLRRNEDQFVQVGYSVSVQFKVDVKWTSPCDSQSK